MTEEKDEAFFLVAHGIPVIGMDRDLNQFGDICVLQCHLLPAVLTCISGVVFVLDPAHPVQTMKISPPIAYLPTLSPTFPFPTTTCPSYLQPSTTTLSLPFPSLLLCCLPCASVFSGQTYPLSCVSPYMSSLSLFRTDMKEILPCLAAYTLAGLYTLFRRTVIRHVSA